MKDIKDYLPYYIGQKCKTDQGVGIIEGVNVTDSCAGTWAVTLDEDSEVYTENDCEWINLVLKRLCDMTDSEALHIGMLAMFDRDMNYPDTDYKVWRPESATVDKTPNCCAVRISNDWYDIEIRIGFISGNIWLVEGSRIYNQPKIFHYLLKQGFDLFGLIDAGLAIDSKTLNPKA